MKLMTAAQLGVTPKILDGIIWVRQQLSSKGGVFANPKNRYDITDAGTRSCRLGPGECGTVGCIGTWAHLYATTISQGQPVEEAAIEEAHEFVGTISRKRDLPVHKLFYPPQWEFQDTGYQMKRSKTRTVQAIDSFLSTGKVPATW